MNQKSSSMSELVQSWFEWSLFVQCLSSARRRSIARLSFLDVLQDDIWSE